jgi:hypothetical protein
LRCHGQRQDQEHQADEAGGADREVDLVDPELMVIGIPGEQHERDQRVDDHEPLGELRVDQATRQATRQRRRTSSRPGGAAVSS